MMWREGGSAPEEGDGGSAPEEGRGVLEREGCKWFSGMEEGYDRTLHTKISKPGCKSFCFIIFFILECM